MEEAVIESTRVSSTTFTLIRALGSVSLIGNLRLLEADEGAILCEARHRVVVGCVAGIASVDSRDRVAFIVCFDTDTVAKLRLDSCT